MIQESIYAPLEFLFGKPLGHIGQVSHSLSAKPFKALSRRRLSTGKERPCIVKEGTQDERYGRGGTAVNHPYIFLMATFGGKAMVTLPYVFQHFCIPVYPNISITSSCHIHSCPEWERDRQWILARPFCAQRPIKRRWRCQQGRSKGKPYRFEEDAMNALVEVSEARMEDWRRKCEQDSDFLSRQEEQLRYHLETLSSRLSLVRFSKLFTGCNFIHDERFKQSGSSYGLGGRSAMSYIESYNSHAALPSIHSILSDCNPDRPYSLSTSNLGLSDAQNPPAQGLSWVIGGDHQIVLEAPALA
ncbi:hypothetical protein ONZ51_g348 [Trametes cubensis]|uniref:Uncharacterized protein n=1 Tax=Trametes cubensis TaxID=1111947 RepID=A0AAD7U3I8_9APHY|nr:hypothetical protein ONZ51_g348 [Trametes cubensis]